MSLEIRPLATMEERRACVALQEATWGAGFDDRVPASILMVAGETGGIASGAFDGGRLVGFVFGVTGLRDGRPIHWSDMLAVAPSHQGRGIGILLKRHQRAALLERGITTVLWTFDPLEARNAHINLHRLGATTRTYRRDLYGRSSSPLHAGIGTDRLLAEWALDSPRVRERLEAPGAGAAPPVPLLNRPVPGGPFPRPGPVDPPGAHERVAVAVPASIQRLKAADPALAVEWRRNVREALESCFARGYTAVDLERGDPSGTDAGWARYLLTRTPS